MTTPSSLRYVCFERKTPSYADLNVGTQISVLIDNIEDIEEDPDAAQILSTFEGTFVNERLYLNGRTDVIVLL